MAYGPYHRPVVRCIPAHTLAALSGPRTGVPAPAPALLLTLAALPRSALYRCANVTQRAAMLAVVGHPRYARTEGLYYLGWFNRTRMPNPELLSVSGVSD